MQTIQTGFKAKNDYTISFESSLLWEAALGIAAVTNTSLEGTLEHLEKMWDDPENGFSPELQHELQIVHAHNTWKALLQLLHHSNVRTLKEWTAEISDMPKQRLRERCLPYIGSTFEKHRIKAAQGNASSLATLQKITKDNPFFPNYIGFIVKVDISFLKSHLISIMTKWFIEVIEPKKKLLQDVLERDISNKKQRLTAMDKLTFIRWVTNSSSYKPDDSIRTILFIPHYHYRPWTILADLPGTKVFYYPIHAGSIDPENKYNPDTMLVRKYKALGDAIRLNLLKRLMESEHTLQYLAEQLPVAKSTLHHHLKMLKSAGLIGSNKQVYYANKDAIASLDHELQTFLEG
ncbi:DNA-binding transcriptional regulator, ArsR family [Terribacillus halophilus]|uniref:DNA-binding transcriptional regulator, ArsR family n=1 Tax=Terribacillus halophilus TaxID=361279 RepID=A0A1G6RRE9_9BACI|nr:metalloregulator ArsR/SmtB family transcription factor [Terribacillus halophilus]SDD06973.1 DNA-binding transcriptional regulator, ArsR family [Terribacillus halophilus]